MPRVERVSQGDEIRLSVLPGEAAHVYAVQETIPEGWEVTWVGADGYVSGRTIRWGPFFDSNPRVLTYGLVRKGPDTGRRRALSGVLSVDGRKIPVGGELKVVGPRKEPPESAGPGGPLLVK